MNGALRFSEAFILGLHAACYLVGLGGERASTAEIARYLGVSEAHLAKVMQRLVRAGLLKSVRGPGGGFTLARHSGDISLLDIYESLEGPFSPTTCLLGRDACLGRSCVLKRLLDAVNSRFEGYLRETDLGSAGSMLRIPDPSPYSGRERSSETSDPTCGGKAVGEGQPAVKGWKGAKGR